MERPKRPYSIQKRPTARKNKFIYYVKFRDENGNYMSALSSGKTTRTAADLWAREYMESGILSMKRNKYFKDFADGFWDYDTSPYIQGRLARGFSFTRSYARVNKGTLENHLIPEFGEMKLTEITRKMVDSWVIRKFQSGELSPNSINKCLNLLRVMLDDACMEGYLKDNPAMGVMQVKTQPKLKNILTADEVKTVFSKNSFEKVWNNNRKYRTANLIAATTGMRQGEIRGLQLQYIHDDHIVVKYSWEERYGLKCPKSGKTRIVPITKNVSDEINMLISESPHTEPDSFLFFGRDPEQPLDKHMFRRTFNDALHNIGISETERKERNITFHSWRHFFNTMCRRASVPDSKLQRITGHSTQKMTEHYTHFDKGDFKEILKIQEKII